LRGFSEVVPVFSVAAASPAGAVLHAAG
jgi:hypothetical protein